LIDASFVVYHTHEYTIFKYEKNNILIRNKIINNKTKQIKNNLEEIKMRNNKKPAVEDVRCKIYSQVLTNTFVNY
jgi:hypothetical protein